MTANTRTLTTIEHNILAMAAKHSYTAFQPAKGLICEALVKEGLLKGEGDSLYTLTDAGAALIGHTRPADPLPAAMPRVILFTADVLAAHDDVLALRGTSKVLYVAALEKLARMVGEARGMGR